MQAREVFPARQRANLSPGQALKTIRELQEMTQEDLARASGISQAAISAMEHDKVKIGLSRARTLARALRVHPAVIVFGDWDDPKVEVNKKAPPPKIDRIAAKTRSHQRRVVV